MQCSVCYEPYDSIQCRPKIVPCGHTFCLKCLLLLHSNECPTCRKSFPGSASDLIDNFIALEEAADFKLVQRSLWCKTCDEAPSVGCIESHEVCSARSMLGHFRDVLREDLRKESELHLQANGARNMLTASVLLVSSQVQEHDEVLTKLVASELHKLNCVGADEWRNYNDVKTVQSAIGESRERAGTLQDILSALDASQAELRIKCGDEWRTLTMGESSRAEDKLLVLTAYALLRLPSVKLKITFELKARVFLCSNGNLAEKRLPDITIEMNERPDKAALADQWSKGWRRYGICGTCLESCHSRPFEPKPLDTEDTAFGKGAVCVGRSSGHYYIILCDDMASRFVLPLRSSFRLVGRVVENLSSLMTAVSPDSAATGSSIEIVPIMSK